MRYNPEDGIWVVGKDATGLEEVRKELGAQEYDRQKQAIKKFLCGYFSTSECRSKQGNSISPLGATKKGGKVLKVRWALPGSGKSGGLRLIVVAYCAQKKAVIAQAFRRKSDPTSKEFEQTFTDL